MDHPPIKFKVTPPSEESTKRTVPHVDATFLAPPIRNKNSPRQKIFITELTPEEKKYKLFDFAKQGGYCEIQELIALGIDLNAKNPLGYTALIWAVIKGHANVVDLLIQSGADIFLTDNKARTALHYAVSKDQEIIAFKLLEKMSGSERSILKKDDFFKDIVIKYRSKQKKFNVNAQNTKGETMFMLAARYGHVGTAKELISAGADVHLKNVKGMTAEEQAKQYRDSFKDTCLQMTEELRQKHTLIFSLTTHQPKATLNLNEEVIIEGVKNLKIDKKSTP